MNKCFLLLDKSFLPVASHVLYGNVPMHTLVLAWRGKKCIYNISEVINKYLWA